MAQTLARLSLKAEESLQILLQCVQEGTTVEDNGDTNADLAGEIARYRLWAGNIGAPNIGTASLDYRLRDAEYLSQHVRFLLEDLIQTVHDGFPAEKRF
jgi:hypothetical protein